MPMTVRVAPKYESRAAQNRRREKIRATSIQLRKSKRAATKRTDFLTQQQETFQQRQAFDQSMIQPYAEYFEKEQQKLEELLRRGTRFDVDTHRRTLAIFIAKGDSYYEEDRYGDDFYFYATDRFYLAGPVYITSSLAALETKQTRGVLFRLILDLIKVVFYSRYLDAQLTIQDIERFDREKESVFADIETDLVRWIDDHRDPSTREMNPEFDWPSCLLEFVAKAVHFEGDDDSMIGQNDLTVTIQNVSCGDKNTTVLPFGPGTFKSYPRYGSQEDDEDNDDDEMDNDDEMD